MGKLANFFKAQGIPLAVKQREQMLALDAEFESLDSQVRTLQAEKLHLKAEVNPLKKYVEGLKKQVEQQKSPSHELNEVRVKMLLVIAEHPYVLTEQIASVVDMGREAAKFHLEEMRQSDLIDNHFGDDGETWTLEHEGRRYLNKHGLLK
jgi:predicted  nucleic acid-binding Zn-ribbon protein